MRRWEYVVTLVMLPMVSAALFWALLERSNSGYGVVGTWVIPSLPALCGIAWGIWRRPTVAWAAVLMVVVPLITIAFGFVGLLLVLVIGSFACAPDAYECPI